MRKPSPFWRMMRMVLNFWPLYVASVLSTIAYLLGDLITRQMTGRVMDAAFALDSVFYRGLIILIGASILAAPFHTTSMLTKYRLSARVALRYRIRVGEKSTVVSFPALRQQRSGDIMAHLGEELQSIDNFVGYGLSMITTLFTTVIGTAAFMLAVDVPLTLIFMASSLLVLPLSLLIARPMKRLEKEKRDAIGASLQAAHEGLQSLVVIKSFRLEKVMDARYRRALRQALAFDLSMMRKVTGMWAGGNALGYLPMMVMLAFGAARVAEGSLTPGMLLSLTMLCGGFVNWLTAVPDIFGYIQRARGACERLYAFLDLPEERGGPVTLPAPGAPMVECCGLSFAYAPEQPVLRELSFALREGEKLALVGVSGSGKSTVLKLICAFLTPDEGRVRVRGVQTGDWDLPALRGQLAYVTQDSYLFPGTIRENLLAARGDADDEALFSVCRRAGILDFVLERGLDAQVGERGDRLSGGEKQRLCIARALLKDAPLLLLDEPTASLDAAAEHVVQQSLDTLMRGRSTLVVAHRLSTIRSADRILVLEEGRVAAEGTHDQLMEGSALYRRLVEQQLMGGEVSA